MTDAPPPPKPARTPRRAGWVRIVLFFAIACAFAALGAYEIALLAAGVGCVVWWIDRGMRRGAA